MPIVAPEFQWKCEPEAEALIKRYLERAVVGNEFLHKLQYELQVATSTRLFDWIDHIEIDDTDAIAQELVKTGFILRYTSDNWRCFYHPGAQLPQFALKKKHDHRIGVALQVDSIADFLMAHKLSVSIEGSPFSGYRRATVSREGDNYVCIVERRGSNALDPMELDAQALLNIHLGYEKSLSIKFHRV